MDKILLFIPMYNCEKQIVRVLGQLTDEVCEYLSEVIIVNNRSTDNGEAAVQNYLETHNIPLNVSLLRNNENYGLGGSHKVAFQYAIKHNFDYVIVLHGDDQGRIRDFLPLLSSGEYTKYDCCLGSRFMKGSKLQGYSAFRTFGNRVYNLLFSVVCGFGVKDLGSGLNLYKVNMLQNQFYQRFTDTLMFNCCMLMALDYYRQNFCFVPVSWREDDQISNVKLFTLARRTLSILGRYALNKKAFMEQELRDMPVNFYTAEVIYSIEGEKKKYGDIGNGKDSFNYAHGGRRNEIWK